MYAIVLQDDGSVLGAAITCAGLALADAGIPMYDVITATTVGIVDDQLLLDPSAAEEDLCQTGLEGNAEHGVVMMSRLATHDQVSELYQSGALSIESLRTINDLLLSTNKEIVPIIKQILVKHVLRNVNNSTKDQISIDNKGK